MKPSALAVCAFGLLIALGACSGGGDDDSAQTIEQRSPTPAGTAITDQQKPNSSQTPDEEEITREQLSVALLTLDDMPTGWTTSPPGENEQGNTDFCGVALMRTVGPVVEIGATFRKAELGPFLAHSLSAFSNGTAAEIMADFREAVQSCTEWTQTDEEGRETTWRIAPLSFPKFGDEIIAFRMSTTITGPSSVNNDMIIMRRDDVINLIAHGGFGPEGIDSQQTEVFAQLADEKLGRIE